MPPYEDLRFGTTDSSDTVQTNTGRIGSSRERGGHRSTDSQAACQNGIGLRDGRLLLEIRSDAMRPLFHDPVDRRRIPAVP